MHFTEACVAQSYTGILPEAAPIATVPLASASWEMLGLSHRIASQLERSLRSKTWFVLTSYPFEALGCCWTKLLEIDVPAASADMVKNKHKNELLTYMSLLHWNETA